MLIGAAVVVGAAIVALGRGPAIGGVANLSRAVRAPIFARARADVDAVCATIDARAGALREHCVRQAEFLLLFPECDGDCRRVAASILPHPRR